MDKEVWVSKVLLHVPFPRSPADHLNQLMILSVTLMYIATQVLVTSAMFEHCVLHQLHSK